MNLEDTQGGFLTFETKTNAFRLLKEFKLKNK